MKPIGYDSASDVRVGYTSIDEHVEVHPFEEPNRHERNCEPFKEIEQGTNIKREWIILGSVDYLFQTIVMSLTSNMYYIKVQSLLAIQS